MHLIAQYEFHSVGQGLFATGSLTESAGHHIWHDEPQFTWVYDCGSSSGKAPISTSILQMQERLAARPVIDMLVLSHFDSDHVNGVASLLSTFRVETLVLPYIPLWQRMLLAFGEGAGVRQQLMKFFTGPATYLQGIVGANIGRIVFVPPSGTEGPPPGSNEDEPLRPDQPWVMRVDGDRRRDDDFAADPDSEGNENGKIRFLRDGGALRIRDLWEFVPYNDAKLGHKATTDFRTKVDRLSMRLLKSASRVARTDALHEIQDEYQQCFGKGARPRNEISLFLYGGLAEQSVGSFDHAYNYRWPPSADWRSAFITGPVETSILYTGDGYVETRGRLSRLLSYLGDNRSKRLHCVQVMHHGARDNWHEGAAARLGSAVSVFSSDPHHAKLGHPHAEVLRDFWMHGPVQVDKENGLHLKVLFHRP